jgi:glycosyltransferase involved in cell wall biosynthesis
MSCAAAGNPLPGGGRTPATLGSLPAPPAGRAGWPWTEGGKPASEFTPGGLKWPRITVVTPSFNQADYLEETLRSVLLQGYPDLEYIVIDGGSTDGSVEIIERYAPWLAHWESEPDRGQSHAINKGFRRATGDVIAWLNSDDAYLESALQAVGELMASSEYDIALGSMQKVETDGVSKQLLKVSTPYGGMPIHYYPILESGPRAWFSFYQPAMFWTKKLWDRVGPLDESYHYVMDLHWCHRALAAGARVGTREEVLVQFSIHMGSKTNDVSHRFNFEQVRMFLELGRRPEFRMGQCLLSTFRHLQVGCGLYGTRLAADGKVWRAKLLSIAAKIVKLVRLGLPTQAESALCWDEHADDGTFHLAESGVSTK